MCACLYVSSHLVYIISYTYSKEEGWLCEYIMLLCISIAVDIILYITHIYSFICDYIIVFAHYKYSSCSNVPHYDVL